MDPAVPLARPQPAAALAERYLAVRAATEQLAAPLSPEDQQLQSMPDCSPIKWHRGHTTWFFETFVLQPAGIPPEDPRRAVLFNSYYEAVGPRQPRPQRGLLSRPTAAEVASWRRRVDERVVALLHRLQPLELTRLVPVIELGLAHEEQHQELMLSDILHAFSCHPHLPAYRGLPEPPTHLHRATGRMTAVRPLGWVSHPGGEVDLGAGDGFAYDHERPRHRRLLAPFLLADRLVTVAELKAFAADGGYANPLLWMAEGFDRVRAEGWRAPLHARWEGQSLVVFGLDGEREAHDSEPVAHLSWYEAEALARYLDARLPTEAEWEAVASTVAPDGNLLEHGNLRPLPASTEALSSHRSGPAQLFGDVWEWTRSAFEPYPGFSPLEGPLGEYNGKFMVGQQVLRGGSCWTPRAHIRASYRNYWPPHTRFQMTGLRLARDLDAPDRRPE